MTPSKRHPVVLAAGGTGGHMFPAEALARALLERGIKTVLITDQRGQGFGNTLPEVETLRIAAGGIAGGSLVGKVRSFAQLGVGYLQARKLLKKIAPATVVGFGGYPSVPTVMAAAHLKRRIVLHEQNAVLGRANRLLAERADIIATSFAEVAAIAPADRHKVTLVGNPVRPAIAETGRRPYTTPHATDRFELLVIGGSQGALVFNEVVPAAVALLPRDLRDRLKVTQQVRGDDLDQVARSYRSSGVESELASFFDDMPQRLEKARLVVCRAGASTITELAAAGRPAILVPYPYATDDHQTANAQALTEAGGGWLMPQTCLGPESLAERLSALMKTPTLLTQAAQGARTCARPDAAERLADIVCGTAGGNGSNDVHDDDENPDREAAA